MDRHLRVDLAASPQKNEENTVFLGNLPFDVKDEELWEEFKEFGEIDYVRVVRDPHSFQGKGIAYVCFKEKRGAKRAIAKNNSEFKGRRIRVDKCRQKGEEKGDKEKNRFAGFYNTAKFKKQSEIYDEAVEIKPRHHSALKGTKKTVRKEQKKLQEKREKRKEQNKAKSKSPKKKQKTKET
jgi:RNA recognition motif-containing protein